MLRTTLKLRYIRNVSHIRAFSARFSTQMPESPINISTFESVAPTIQEKIENLGKSQPFFDRLIFFDPDIMASLPGPLQVFDPMVERTKVF